MIPHCRKRTEKRSGTWEKGSDGYKPQQEVGVGTSVPSFLTRVSFPFALIPVLSYYDQLCVIKIFHTTWKVCYK